MIPIGFLHYKNIEELSVCLQALFIVFLSFSKATNDKDQTVNAFADYRVYLKNVNIPFEVIHVSIKYILMTLREKPMPEFNTTIINAMINEIERNPLASVMCIYKVAGSMAYRRGLKRNIILDKESLLLKDNPYFLDSKRMLIKAWVAGYDQERKNSVN